MPKSAQGGLLTNLGYLSIQYERSMRTDAMRIATEGLLDLYCQARLSRPIGSYKDSTAAGL